MDHLTKSGVRRTGWKRDALREEASMMRDLYFSETSLWGKAIVPDDHTSLNPSPPYGHQQLAILAHTRGGIRPWLCKA